MTDHRLASETTSHAGRTFSVRCQVLAAAVLLAAGWRTAEAQCNMPTGVETSSGACQSGTAGCCSCGRCCGSHAPGRLAAHSRCLLDAASHAADCLSRRLLLFPAVQLRTGLAESEIVESWGLDRHTPRTTGFFAGSYKESVKPPKPVTQFSQMPSTGRRPTGQESSADSQPWQGLSVLLPDSRPGVDRRGARYWQTLRYSKFQRSMLQRRRRKCSELESHRDGRGTARISCASFPAKTRAMQAAPMEFESSQVVQTTLAIKEEQPRSTVSIPPRTSSMNLLPAARSNAPATIKAELRTTAAPSSQKQRQE